MLEWLFDVPLWVMGPLMAGLLGLFALAGLRVVRSRVLPRLTITFHDSEFVGTMVSGMIVFYGLSVALIAVKVWETYADVSKTVSAEASAVAAIYRDISVYPEPARGQLQDQLRGYVEYVIEEAWPAQRAGRVPSGGVDWMNRTQEILAGFEPASEGQRILHAEVWRAYNRLIEVRRLRLDSIETGLPAVLWAVILLGAVICLTSSFFFAVVDARLHATLVVLLAVFIGMVIFVVLAMDRPFRGDLGIPPRSYQLVYDQLMRPSR